ESPGEAPFDERQVMEDFGSRPPIRRRSRMPAVGRDRINRLAQVLTDGVEPLEYSSEVWVHGRILTPSTVAIRWISFSCPPGFHGHLRLPPTRVALAHRDPRR